MPIGIIRIDRSDNHWYSNGFPKRRERYAESVRISTLCRSGSIDLQYTAFCRIDQAKRSSGRSICARSERQRSRHPSPASPRHAPAPPRPRTGAARPVRSTQGTQHNLINFAHPSNRIFATAASSHRSAEAERRWFHASMSPLASERPGIRPPSRGS